MFSLKYSIAAISILSGATKATDLNDKDPSADKRQRGRSQSPSYQVSEASEPLAFAEATTEADATRESTLDSWIHANQDLQPRIISYLPDSILSVPLYFPKFKRLMRSVAFNDVLEEIGGLTQNENRDSLVSYVWRVSRKKIIEVLRSVDFSFTEVSDFD